MLFAMETYHLHGATTSAVAAAFVTLHSPPEVPSGPKLAPFASKSAKSEPRSAGCASGGLAFAGPAANTNIAANAAAVVMVSSLVLC